MPVSPQHAVRYRAYPQFGSDHELLRQTVRTWCERSLYPNVAAWEAARLFPREVFTDAAALGLLGIRIPEALGGQGLDWWFTVAYAEELVHSGMSGLAMALLVQSDMATPVIHDIGTDYHYRNFLTPAVRGEAIAALGVTEPDAGSDVANLRTTARRDGGDFVINGQKTFITNGTRADFVTLAVRTGGEGAKGLSLILVPRDAPGFSVGRKLEKLGNHCSDTAELFFEDCRVPVANLLGHENAGFYYIMQNFQGERLVTAVTAVAAAQRMIDRTIAFTEERHAFGRALLGFQTIRHELVQLEAELEAARQLNYRAVDLVHRGHNAMREITMAKLIAAELASRVADRCLQFHGGTGYMAEHEIARAWRDARLLSIGGGASEIMREILAKLHGLSK